MRLLVDRVPSMLAYWGSDQRCRFANRAYGRWFGVAPESLIGHSIRDLLGPELFALDEPYIRGALRGEEQLFERIVPGPGGAQRHSLANYIPDTVDGVVFGFLVQVTEITKLKEVEAALEREHALRQQLEQHAHDLNILLGERSDMMYVLAHEVRQPLNNASAALQSAAATLAEVGEQVAAARLTRAQTVMCQVQAAIDNTLAVAGLLGQQGALARVDSDIDALLAVAIADMPAHDRARIQVERVSSTRTASMDLQLMRLALRNLLSNALAYSPPEAAVTVRLVDSDEPLALVIDVIDAGPGVELPLVPRLFERGTRGKRASAPGGHGLGLFIVRRVMELHDGQVVLARNGPTGATMRLIIAQTPAG